MKLGITETELRRRFPRAKISGPKKTSARITLQKRRQLPNGNVPKLVYELRIADWMPTPLNRLLGAHWGTRARMKRHDRELISYEVAVQGVRRAECRRHVSLRITLPPRKRAVDPDAIWKVLLDSLVNCGTLVNDSAAWCELGGVEFVRGDELETVIRLEDL